MQFVSQGDSLPKISNKIYKTYFLKKKKKKKKKEWEK